MKALFIAKIYYDLRQIKSRISDLIKLETFNDDSEVDELKKKRDEGGRHIFF